MSEAETPNNPSDLFEPNSSQDAPAPAETPKTEVTLPEWVTINFPDAIGVDDVPRTPEQSQTGLRIQDLERQNQKLVARIAELTDALSTAQTARKAEADRHAAILQAQSEDAQKRFDRDAQLAQQQASLIVKQRQALDAAKQRLSDQELQLADSAQQLLVAHDRVMQLSQDLDRAAQTEHKQQILIETLTAQLEASQTQVAQLERDCAITKQRYDEQIQLVRQTETACRDLRSRLHRQQQYTLQFKAALEKCLDVPAAQGAPTIESVSTAATPTLAIVPREELSTHCFVKAQPVQPWSASPEFLPPSELILDSTPESVEDLVSTEAALSENPFADLSNLEELWSDSTESILESPQDLTPIEAPMIALENDEAITPLSYTIGRSIPNAAPPSHPIRLFTPSASEGSSLESAPIQAIAEQASFGIETEVETASLPSLELRSAEIETPEAIEPTALEPLTEQPKSENQPDLIVVETSGSDLMNTVTVLDQFETQAIELTQSQSQPKPIQPSPFITLNSEAISQPIRGEELPLTDASEDSPSPIVYPDRAQKKIPSLAAVELPSFPKASK